MNDTDFTRRAVQRVEAALALLSPGELPRAEAQRLLRCAEELGPDWRTLVESVKLDTSCAEKRGDDASLS